jgi:hypothetical protein
MPVIGYLTFAGGPLNTGFDSRDPYGGAFLEGRAKAGYVPGRNLAIEIRRAFQKGDGITLPVDPQAPLT